MNAYAVMYELYKINRRAAASDHHSNNVCVSVTPWLSNQWETDKNLLQIDLKQRVAIQNLETLKLKIVFQSGSRFRLYVSTVLRRDSSLKKLATSSFEDNILSLKNK